MPKGTFLSPADEQAIVDAIRLAERRTTGEIRVHVESMCGKEPLDRAREVFAKLGMHQTEQRNGILLYIAFKSRKAAIFGDVGIAALIPQELWDTEFETLRRHFREDRYALGITQVVTDMGERLAEHFPAPAGADERPGDNPDELSNQVSFE